MAKIEDYKELSDSEIVTIVENNIKMSVGYYDSDLSRERQSQGNGLGTISGERRPC